MTFVQDLDFRGLVHCETATLDVLLRNQGVVLSEAMLFGLGSGLSFVYWDSKDMRVPFLGGRVRPFVLTTNLATRLGLDLTVKETSSPRKAWAQVAGEIDRGRPVGLQVDSFYLDYFTSRVHFGGHMIAMYGYDDDDAWLVDTDQQGGAVRTRRSSLADARGARGPMTAQHRSFTLRVPSADLPWQGAILPAIVACASAFLNPPIANLGHRGIEKAGTLVSGWLDRADDPPRDLPLAAQLMEHGGTGGALFRNLYRDFLGESAELLGHQPLHNAHGLYAEAASGWSEVAVLVEQAGISGTNEELVRAGRRLHELARIEREAMTLLVDLPGQR